MDRRSFLKGSMGASLLSGIPAEIFAQTPVSPSASNWDSGELVHLLPTVNDREILIKASFLVPQDAQPVLRVGSNRVEGQLNDSTGRFWQFHARDLEPGRDYELSLRGARNSLLCEPWNLRTFPAFNASPERLRALFFTCAGGRESTNRISHATRNRLLNRGLSFQPDIALANGDHVYWDLHSPRTSGGTNGASRRDRTAGTFDESALIFGNDNETVLKLAAGTQITPIYGTDFRSTPVFFLQDDHDYFDNDEATDEAVTFPPTWFMIQLARATQRMYYPEFLADNFRPLNLPWSSLEDRNPGLSESYGTVRFGQLAEIALYDVRRTMTLRGPTAVFINQEIEKWLMNRAAATDVNHFVHVPSNPPGWSAGKWGEWYPDILNDNGELTTSIQKPYWQQGWLSQHDRLMNSLSSREDRIPLVISGDLHAIALGQIERSGSLDFTRNPINAVLCGPIGTGPGGWPSAFRGVGPSVPNHLDLRQQILPLEQHGFTLVDFLPDRILLQFFSYLEEDPIESIDTLEPFYVTELAH